MSSFNLGVRSALRIAVLLGFIVGLSFVFNQEAFAADTVSNSTFQDTDGNGTVNRIRWTMDETVTACAYEAGDWTVNTASELNFVITGITCTGANAFLDITVTSDTNETGVITAPLISYANVGTAGSVTLTSGVMTAKASQSTIDGAAPVVVSTTPASAATSVSASTDIVIAFSERMDAGFVEATEFTVTPDPGAFVTAWSGDETTVTLTFPDLACGTVYAVTTAEAAITASSGVVLPLITTGPQDGDWSFTVNACASSPAVTPATVSAFSYVGPNCSLQNAQTFSVTGSNIAAYLASDNALFYGAEWVGNPVQGTDEFEVIFNSNPARAYIALKGSEGPVTDTYTFDLEDWQTTCTPPANTPDNTNEVDNTPTNNEPGNDVIPVAGVSPGDVIHSSNSSAIYYVTAAYGRRVFINEASYFTWFSSFNIVKEVTATTMAALPLEGNMLPKAGVVLVKIQSSPVVYFLDNGSDEFVPVLRAIGDEATAAQLFGNLWADYVIDIEPTFFTKFAAGTEIGVGENLNINLSGMKKRVNLHE